MRAWQSRDEGGFDEGSVAALRVGARAVAAAVPGICRAISWHRRRFADGRRYVQRSARRAPDSGVGAAGGAHIETAGRRVSAFYGVAAGDALSALSAQLSVLLHRPSRFSSHHLRATGDNHPAPTWHPTQIGTGTRGQVQVPDDVGHRGRASDAVRRPLQPDCQRPPHRPAWPAMSRPAWT